MNSIVKYTVFFFIIVSTTLLFSCKNDIDEINKIVIHDSFPLESAQHVEITYSDSGMVKALLRTTQLDRYDGPEPYIEMTKGVDMYFFDGQKEISSTLSATSARNYERKDYLEAFGNVIIVNERKEQLKTEHLIWDRKKKKIETKEFVKITTPTEVMWGDGLTSDEKFINWRILFPRGSFFITQTEKDTIDQLD